VVAAIGVLGPLVLDGPDGPIRLGSARQRRLLAALVAHQGAGIGAGELIELIWETAPADPSAALHTVVARLRALLPPGVRISTELDGYRLVTDPLTVDVAAFVDHLSAAAAVSDPRHRLRRLEAGLALWRGRPYPELDHPLMEPEVARLEELRFGAAEQHAGALLALGRTGAAVAALEALIAAEPLREGAVALLMRAMVAAGRPTDALGAFARLRTRLADELGLDPTPELRALEQQVLRQELDIPAPSAPPPQAARLPLSSFVGRDGDVARAAALLAGSRLVTLCGPGGVGKTRLATHVAAAVSGSYDDGVLVVEFGEGGADDVEPVLAAALNLADAERVGTGSVADRIVELLAARSHLLVLDNCEHVADQVAPLVEAITVGAPGVDVLVTSREPLRVDGEHLLAVAPLDPESAARLLTDRIGGPGAGTAPEPDEAELVSELCRRLDGLPLAIELAAARAAALGLRGLVDALDSPLDVLRGGRRTASPRHRSLRDVVAWSYGLLDDAQRTLFDRLSVFAGPVEFAAVAEVCGDAGALPDLVARSLVLRTPAEPARFGMLETLRAFGGSRLATDPAAVRLRADHAAWAVRLAVEITAARRGPGEAAAIRRFDDHLADLRRAHRRLCEHGPAENLLRLGILFSELGYLRGRIDLIRLAEEALTAAGVLEPDGTPSAAASPVAGHPLAAVLLGLHAMTCVQRGDLDAAESCAGRAVAIAEAAGEPAAARFGRDALTDLCRVRGELAEALRRSHASLGVARAGGDPEIEFHTHLQIVLASVAAGDDETAARHESAMAGLAVGLATPTFHAYLAYAGGQRRAALGDPDAPSYLEEAIRLAEEVDSRFVAGVARHALLTSDGQEPADAAAGFGQLIDHWHGFGAWTHLWITIRALIGALSRRGQHGDVAVLLGAMGASPRAARVFGVDPRQMHDVEQAARAALGSAFEPLLAEGAALGETGAVATARRLTLRALRPDRDPAAAPIVVPRAADRPVTGAWAPTRTAQRIRYVRSADRAVAWTATGSGPPLVFGGWWLSHLELDWRDPAFRAFVERLAQQHTVVRYDRPGTGLADHAAPPSTGLEEEVAVLGDVVDAVVAELGTGSVALLAVSSGGAVAGIYTARRPDRVSRLVLYGSCADGSQVAQPRVRESLLALVEQDWELGSRVLADLFLPGADSAEREAFARAQREAAGPEVAARTLAAVYGFDARAEIGHVRRPTLVLHRANDTMVGSMLGRELAALVPGAVFTALDGHEHLPWRGDADRLAAEVLTFLGPEVPA
jgi:predicted ATPase/DNA-binding SARP family transcriptional activator/pimeloyl-ACP methyl ester carboxylesterase